MTSVEPLQIAVVGMGGIGSTFAFHLARIGHHDVTAIARPGSPRLQQLQRDRGVLSDKGEHAPMRITDTLDEATPYDLVLVTLLDHQVDAMLPALCRSAAKKIQFMFNTYDPERLQSCVGAARCSFGMPFVQASVDKEGRLHAKVGAGGQKSKVSDQDWVKVFTHAGLPAIFEPRMLLWLRCHVLLRFAFESVSVAGSRRDSGASWERCMVLARGVQASYTLLQRLGYEIYPRGKSWLKTGPAWSVAGMLWFLSRIRSFRELLATGEVECRALVDAVVATAAQAKPRVSTKSILSMKP